MTFTVPHVGPRHVERFELVPTLVDEPRTVMGPDSFWNLPLPLGVLLDPTYDPLVGPELARQATLATPNVNTHSFSSPITLVPPDQPLVPVAMPWDAPTKLKQVFATGLPIPDGFVPQDDSDGHAVFYQPDYVGPAGHYGRLYEAWKFKQLTDGSWHATFGGRMVNTHGNPGYYSTWTSSGYQWANAGHPDSTYMESSWGANATGLPLVAGLITVEDLHIGVIEHAVSLCVVQARPGHRWPAQRNDGGTADNPVQEGMRLRFAPDALVPEGLHPVAEVIWQAGQTYGFVVDDKGGALNFSAEPACQRFFDGTPGYGILDGFPWGDLQVLVTGSKLDPNPQ